MFNKKSPEQTKDEIGLIDALGLMFNVRKEIRELAAEMDEKNGLSATYQHKEGLHIMDQMIKHNSTLFKSIFAERAKKTDLDVRKVVTLAKYENLIAYYNALRCICEREYDTFMNTTLWNDIIKPLTKREHSQFGIVAITRAAMVDVNKETWKAYLARRDKIMHIDECRVKNREEQLQYSLLKKQASARDQMKEVITEEWADKWAKAGITEEDLKQFALMKGIDPDDKVTSGHQKDQNMEDGK